MGNFPSPLVLRRHRPNDFHFQGSAACTLSDQTGAAEETGVRPSGTPEIGAISEAMEVLSAEISHHLAANVAGGRPITCFVSVSMTRGGTAPCPISREPRIAVELPCAEYAYFGPFVSHRLGRYLGFAALIVFRPAPKSADQTEEANRFQQGW
jgi:hypothetical protein